MGLELKPSKTRITHTLVPHEGQVGFDFLGYEVRQYPVGKTHSKQGFKTLIKPSKEAQIRHCRRLREVVKAYKAAPQAALIDRLNPIIRGWANYFSNVWANLPTARWMPWCTKNFGQKHVAVTRTRTDIGLPVSIGLSGLVKDGSSTPEMNRIQCGYSTMTRRRLSVTSRCKGAEVPTTGIGFTGVAEWGPINYDKVGQTWKNHPHFW